MRSFEEYYQSSFRNMFLTLKILALFFFSVPLIQYLARKTGSELSGQSLFSTFIIMGFLLVIFGALLWFLGDKRKTRHRVCSLIEVGIFFLFCCSLVWTSGGVMSYYKFIFIFLIVLYTIEFGMTMGLTLAALSSAVLLGMDLVMAGSAQVNVYFEKDLVLSGVFFIVAWALGFYVKVGKSTFRQLREDANLDGLTRVYNHRYFYDKIREECLISSRESSELALIMMDIDYFKIYNDMYGHQQGDASLSQLAALLQEHIPAPGTLCRYGGEEFVIILKGMPFEEVISFAERMRQLVADTPFYGEEHMPHRNFTVSLGVAEFKRGMDTYQELISRADATLYRAKFMRRNSTRVYSSIFGELEESADLKDKLQSLKALITVIHSRDSYTYQHVERVVYLCQKFAAHLGLSQDDRRTLTYAAYLHDLGKINIEKEILITDKRLTDSEWEELKSHPVESVKIIEKIEGFADVLPVVIQHHEHYDGTGYPAGLSGRDICYLARILTIVDSFDAMTSTRPYQKARTEAEALQEIMACEGTHFDPELAGEFVAAMEQNISN